MPPKLFGERNVLHLSRGSRVGVVVYVVVLEHAPVQVVRMYPNWAALRITRALCTRLGTCAKRLRVVPLSDRRI